MKKVIRLTEQDLVTILKDILSGVTPNFKNLNFLSNNTSDEDIKKILEKDSSNSLTNIRQDFDEYKKLTDQRIEKLVKLFLSIK